MDTNKLYAFAVNPWAVIGSLALGGAFGLLLPVEAQKLGLVGDIYVNLLKMTTLPFMISAVIFSLQRLFREGGGTSKLLVRVLTVFACASVLVAVVGAIVLLVMRPGANLSRVTM